MTGDLVADLAEVGDVIVDPEILEGYRRDQAAPGLLLAGMPAAVVRPRSTAAVQATIRAAARYGAPIVPRGAGSGLSGGANAIDGCIVLSLEHMTEVLHTDPEAMTATASPGVLNVTLRQAAAEHDLWYAPDPASYEFSTIGGNVATNAGGMCCLKYGVTRDALLGLEVVLADGRAMRLGRRTRKGVAGYDLVSLMCGSEGTLGVITEVTVRLLPRPQPPTTMVATFPDLVGAGRAVADIVRETTPSMLEIMDASTIAAVETFRPMGLDPTAAAVLFARSDATRDAALQEAQRMAARCEKAGADFVALSTDEAEGELLLGARRMAYPALENMGATLLDDVAVPIGHLARLLGGMPRVAAAHEVMIGTFGHAGDGNLHPTIVYPHGDLDAARRARAAFVDIIQLALALGGTVTGEHGVGLLKRDLLDAELGVTLEMHRVIKQALDPNNLLNPGKAL